MTGAERWIAAADWQALAAPLRSFRNLDAVGEVFHDANLCAYASHWTVKARQRHEMIGLHDR